MLIDNLIINYNFLEDSTSEWKIEETGDVLKIKLIRNTKVNSKGSNHTTFAVEQMPSKKQNSS